MGPGYRMTMTADMLRSGFSRYLPGKTVQSPSLQKRLRILVNVSVRASGQSNALFYPDRC